MSSNSTALITGAGSGIGRAVAHSLAGSGFRLALMGRTRSKLEQVKQELGAAGESTLIIEGDVADRAKAHAAVGQAIEHLGKIDILVCNAGVNVPNRSMDKLDPSDWDKMIAANLTGAYNLVYAALPSMREHKNGLIIQICSISGMRAGPLGGVGYSASKYGQAALGICVAREERGNGIRSTVIYPGEVDTPILENRPVKVEADRRKLILQAEDVAAAVKFVVDLPPRAHVFELVIKPTVDDFV